MTFNCVFHLRLQFSVFFSRKLRTCCCLQIEILLGCSTFKFSSVLQRLGCEPEKNACMPKCQPSTALVVLATPSDAAPLFHMDEGNKGSFKFFSMYVFWKYEHNPSIFSTSLESRESCSHYS